MISAEMNIIGYHKPQEPRESNKSVSGQKAIGCRVPIPLPSSSSSSSRSHRRLRRRGREDLAALDVWSSSANTSIIPKKFDTQIRNRIEWNETTRFKYHCSSTHICRATSGHLLLRNTEFANKLNQEMLCAPASCGCYHRRRRGSPCGRRRRSRR